MTRYLYIDRSGTVLSVRVVRDVAQARRGGHS
jgi:hypothetical protein